MVNRRRTPGGTAPTRRRRRGDSGDGGDSAAGRFKGHVGDTPSVNELVGPLLEFKGVFLTNWARVVTKWFLQSLNLVFSASKQAAFHFLVSLSLPESGLRSCRRRRGADVLPHFSAFHSTLGYGNHPPKKKDCILFAICRCDVYGGVPVGGCGLRRGCR